MTLVYIKDRIILTSVALCLVVLLAMLAIDTQASQIILPSLKLERGLTEIIQNFVTFVFDTGDSLTLFGSIPRNGAALLLFAAYLMRLKLWYAMSYALIPLMLLTHFLSGFLIFLIFHY